MPLLNGQCIGNELMVQALEDCVLIVLFLIFDQAYTVVGVELAGIELIEGQPVIHPVTQTLEQGAGCSAYSTPPSCGSSSRRTLLPDAAGYCSAEW